MPLDIFTTDRDLAAWDDAVRASPMGSLFLTTPWRECAQWHTGDRMLYAGWRDADGRLSGGVTIAERRRWGLRLGVQPLGTPYLGFWLAAQAAADSGAGPPDTTSRRAEPAQPPHLSGPAPPVLGGDAEQYGAIVRELMAWVKRRFHCAYFQTPPEWPGPPPEGQGALPRGWATPVRRTLLVSLGGEKDMWARLRGNARRLIRRAREAGWETVVMERGALFPDEREAVRRLLAATHQRVGHTLYPEPFVERLLTSEAMGPHRLTLWARPGLGAAPGAMLTVVFDPHRAYYLLPLAEDGALRAGAMYLLVWEAMSRMAARGVPVFDLLGANLPHLVRFKENFGGAAVSYRQWQCWRWPWLRWVWPPA
ncbi:MAG: hypothetical protein Kow0059_04990 [Candidatus Sumerlaeia bacterium]